MQRHELKDKYNNRLGHIETDASGKQTLKDKYNTIKGYYDPKTNTTKDRYNNKIGSGNLLTTLL